jgi:apyrase
LDLLSAALQLQNQVVASRAREAMALLLLLLTATVGAARAVSEPVEPKFRFGIVMDAGSSGTRVHIFGYYSRGVGKLPLLALSDGHWEKKIRPGLSSFVGKPSAAGENIRMLLKFAAGKVRLS